MTKIILAGGFGKLGQAIQDNLSEEYEIVGIVSGHQHESKVPVWTSLSDINVTADIWLDVSTPATVFDNAMYAIEHNMQLVIGATGLSDEQVATLREQSSKGVLIVPNFSLSAVLLMQFSQLAAKYFPDAEIIEAHNPKKIDAPSGTAKQTARLIAKARIEEPTSTKLAPARGEQIDRVPVHAVRLPGYIAQQSVYFGGVDEQLTLTQSTTSRSAFVPGVIRAIEAVKNIDGVVIGLDQII
ncbi:4-hydroxy-tetrahydrodipicolinate reductase [Leuconostoc suionicum]|uniref:4-hydroxy-tetrahydrodipicolinate reductase n=1 Tax=Leuconostoc suionicum TaxID=1511761 RepID=UPI0021A9D505|nr:4-hydroxy-tetrahydrodipicolinate reductase [Leuconostoc suionicum]MCT4381941.1 4-hydroxy-tetrahydrodipicolinate reductase [Leuconostoc suionicum]MDC2805517.1 4-hydroxy-tetrahydrodipicolinate reductase [Leuconostoc suionicum]MDC2815745.1 4-hydroxy-tetrahydrodipicolinate reductase [Leuconostoc suionicum]MDC2823029.1 4-hydroxy-tetrahydrodipicolinate reductase [Leuconostoc suionicum]